MERLVGKGRTVREMSSFRIWLYMCLVPLGLGAAAAAIPLCLAALAYGSRAAFEACSITYYLGLLSYITCAPTAVPPPVAKRHCRPPPSSLRASVPSVQ